MNVRWSMVIATVMFAGALGLAYGWPWAVIPTGIVFLGTVWGR